MDSASFTPGSGEQVINDNNENVCKLKDQDKEKAVIEHFHGCLLREPLSSRKAHGWSKMDSPALYPQWQEGESP
jgi:hypothetical protein